MEFVPVDAVAHVRDVVIGMSLLALLVRLVEEPVRVGALALHVAQPFAGEHAAFGAQAPVGDEHALDGRVDAALEPVARPLRRASVLVLKVGLEEREERAVPPQPFEPPVAAAQRLVGPPPRLLYGARVVGMLALEGAFVRHGVPAAFPVMQLHGPAGGLVGFPDRQERVGQSLELASGLQAWPARQVVDAVAVHVHQAALDAGGRPRAAGGRFDAAHPVAYQHVRRGDLLEQRQIVGGGLVAAPSERDHRAAVAVDDDQQAAAVAQVGAVGHEHVPDHAIGLKSGAYAPTVRDPSAERARRAGLGHRSEQPREERVELGAAPTPVMAHPSRGVAGGAHPPLRAESVVSVLLHRRAAHLADPRPRRSRSHASMQP